jgi:hypothetical protein
MGDEMPGSSAFHAYQLQQPLLSWGSSLQVTGGDGLKDLLGDSGHDVTAAAVTTQQLIAQHPDQLTNYIQGKSEAAGGHVTYIFLLVGH